MIGYRGCYRYVDQPDLFRARARRPRRGRGRRRRNLRADDPVRPHRLGARARASSIVARPPDGSAACRCG